MNIKHSQRHFSIIPFEGTYLIIYLYAYQYVQLSVMFYCVVQDSFGVVFVCKIASHNKWLKQKWVH